MECVTCVCFWLGAGWEVLGGECVRGLGLGITHPGGTGGRWDLCFGCGGVGGSVWAACAMICEGGMVLSMCLL